MNKQEERKRIQTLLSLIDPRWSSKDRIKLIEQVGTISGFDMVFILAIVTRYNFSGNLSIVNEENELSGVAFIYGDIVRVDYPDQEHMLGNVIVDSEVLSNIEMQEIIEKSKGYRLGDYLLVKKHLTEAQLRQILLKQSRLRLTKYLSSKNLRMNFTFEGQSNDSVLISKVNYTEILYSWLFEVFHDDWMGTYAEYYATNDIVINLQADDFQYLKDFPKVSDVVGKLVLMKKESINYNDVFKIANMPRHDLIRVLHFLVLTGYILIRRNKIGFNLGTTGLKFNPEQLDMDLLETKKFLLAKKYFEAFGILNKYSTLISSHEKVNFYFIWIKLIGAFYNNHLLDLKKIAQDISEIDAYQIEPAEYYYVRALSSAVTKNYAESDQYYAKAVEYNALYKSFPVNDNSSFTAIIKKFFKTLGVTS
ncbi:hypothetical protein K2P97_02625 [bacterium]|nr:hypothetical protein [bacterium]